jgi:nucleoside-diphosphate-sugar epimerase
VQRAALTQWAAGVFNVGTGVETTLRSLYSKVQKALGVGLVEPLYVAENRGELRRNALSHRRLAETLGVAPTVELDAGLQQTLPYYRRKHARLEA